MSQLTTRERITKLESAFAAGVFEPFIRDLRFPYYKNFARGTRIDFTFPITVITGQNGTNKSSVLKALYGCCKGRSLGELWFSSATDTILVHPEHGSTRYIYSYENGAYGATSEVLQNHRRRERKGELVDPDYWETSKPSKKDGMKTNSEEIKRITGRTRWRKIPKTCTFIDFRSELSAFDRFFYHVPLNRSRKSRDKRDLIRARSPHLQQAMINKSNYERRFGKGSWSVEYKEIPNSLLEVINNILGKKYTSIVLLNHNLFGFSGSTVSIRLESGTSYTEAFAGSGEFAVITLVAKLHALPEYELVLIDEPEMSLHPSAQQKMINYICDITLRKKLQVVISTHSPFIIEDMPRSAIKTLYSNEDLVDVLQDCESDQAFFYIAPSHVHQRALFFEDRLAAEITHFVAKTERDQGYANQFTYNALPGGHTEIKGKFIVAASQSNNVRSFYLLDGDQRPLDGHADPSTIPEAQNDKLDTIIKKQSLGQKIEFPQNSNDPIGAIQSKRDYLKFWLGHVYYLPRRTPEEILVENSIEEDVQRHRAELGTDYKEILHRVARERLRKVAGEKTSADEIFMIQKLVLAELPSENPDYQQILQILQNVLDQPL